MSTMKRTLAAASVVLAMAVGGGLVGGLAFAGQAPKLSIQNLADLPIVNRAPYDVQADAGKQLDVALTRAKKAHKRVLIDLGGNWCPDCQILANLMQQPELKKYLEAHFEIVLVDVGRFDKNQDIPARYGIAERLKGVPAILAIDPTTGKSGTVVNRDEYYALSDARHMNAQGIADWLARWAK